jgi:2-polyprenyl-6-methoxyphenol hydroxylase-like FAD-dependent oxidoreductase
VLQQGSDRFDVVVVGARCAGSPLATLLSRAGLDVCLVDRATFPSDTPSTHGIQPCGVQVLERLGVRDAVEATTEPVAHGRLAFDDNRAELTGFDRKVGAPMLNVRRVTLDAILLDAAADAGVEVRTGTSVTGLIESDGRVAGVETTAGALSAPLVVGGDGARSTDPTPGQGISDALRQVVELSEAIESALGGGADPDRVLREWWAWRDRDAWEMYWFAQEMANPTRAPLLNRVVEERLAEDPQLVEGLVRVLNHELPPSELFGLRFGVAAIGTALVRERGRRLQVLAEARTLMGDQLRRRKPPSLPNR